LPVDPWVLVRSLLALLALLVQKVRSFTSKKSTIAGRPLGPGTQFTCFTGTKSRFTSKKSLNIDAALRSAGLRSEKKNADAAKK
jgi:hypothetical protein